jgi:hypothetical protein
MVLSARDRRAIDATVRIRKLVTVRERMLLFCVASDTRQRPKPGNAPSRRCQRFSLKNSMPTGRGSSRAR